MGEKLPSVVYTDSLQMELPADFTVTKEQGPTAPAVAPYTHLFWEGQQVPAHTHPAYNTQPWLT